MPGPDQLRTAIKSHGERRREALDTADRELQAIAALVPAAREAGISIAELARLGAVSRPTLYGLLPRDDARQHSL